MGTFHVGCGIENHVHRQRHARVARVLVDTGSEHTWISAQTLEKIGLKREKEDISLVLANGQVVARDVGFAIIRVGKSFTIDEVIFAQKGDLQILGARTLEGLNLTVDSQKKKLVASGPAFAAK